MDVRTTAKKSWQGYKRTKQPSVSEKEQGSQTFLNQPQNKSFCFERILQFKVSRVKGDMLWCLEIIETLHRIEQVIMYFLLSVCLGLAAVLVNRVLKPRAGEVKLL